MSYQWGPGGPAFEFPTSFRTENRYLLLRAALLAVLAAVILVLALTDVRLASGASATLRRLGRVSSTPHLLMATFMIGLALVDLWQMSRQRATRLSPGQPAALISQTVRHANGAGASVGWLTQMLGGGAAPLRELAGPYQRALRQLAPKAAIEPACVQAWLERRLAHLLVAGSLLLVLGAGALLVRRPPVVAFAGAVFALVMAALLVRTAWALRPAPRPWKLGLMVLLVAAGALGLGGLATRLPESMVSSVAAIGLPAGAALGLGALVVIEALALLAGRTPVVQPMAEALSPAPARVEVMADAEHLMQEIERELHRYWAEGVPNRRYAWQSTLEEHRSDGARFTSSLLEESQPMLPDSHRSAMPEPGGMRRQALRVAGVLGLLLTATGGGLWLWMQVAQLRGVDATWTWASAAVLLMLVGGHAVRIGHLLWSRIEVDSWLLWLECKSTSSRGAAATDTAPLEPTAAPASRDGPALRLRWSAVRARSFFYAAAEHQVGNRVLLRLTADKAAARKSALDVKGYAEKLSAAAADPRVPARAPAGARPSAPAAAPDRQQTLFCRACGKPIARGARFCPLCGADQQSV